MTYPCIVYDDRIRSFVFTILKKETNCIKNKVNKKKRKNEQEREREREKSKSASIWR